MEMVYASLILRRPDVVVQASGAAEVVDALWVHAEPGDGLQHASARPVRGRLDLLLYFLSREPSDGSDAVGRAHSMITRTHRASPALRRWYLPPEPLPRAA
jgi:hypothetical protein